MLIPVCRKIDFFIPIKAVKLIASLKNLKDKINSAFAIDYFQFETQALSKV